MSDPLIYKVLALLQVLMWTSFLYRYTAVLVLNETLRLPHRARRAFIAADLFFAVLPSAARVIPRRVRELQVFSERSILARFAGAVLMIALAMVFYGLATVLRQFLGADYWGRDAVRITASSLILLSGLIFHIVLSRDKRRPVVLRRRSTDLP